jgi:hypothetical protein
MAAMFVYGSGRPQAILVSDWLISKKIFSSAKRKKILL